MILLLDALYHCIDTSTSSWHISTDNCYCKQLIIFAFNLGVWVKIASLCLETNFPLATTGWMVSQDGSETEPMKISLHTWNGYRWCRNVLKIFYGHEEVFLDVIQKFAIAFFSSKSLSNDSCTLSKSCCNCQMQRYQKLQMNPATNATINVRAPNDLIKSGLFSFSFLVNFAVFC